MFSKIFVLLALCLALASAFVPSRFAVKSTAVKALLTEAEKTERSPDGRCLKKDLDVKGKCPGDAGYKPPLGKGKMRLYDLNCLLEHIFSKPLANFNTIFLVHCPGMKLLPTSPTSW